MGTVIVGAPSASRMSESGRLPVLVGAAGGGVFVRGRGVAKWGGGVKKRGFARPFFKNNMFFSAPAGHATFPRRGLRKQNSGSRQSTAEGRRKYGRRARGHVGRGAHRPG